MAAGSRRARGRQQGQGPGQGVDGQRPIRLILSGPVHLVSVGSCREQPESCDPVSCAPPLRHVTNHHTSGLPHVSLWPLASPPCLELASSGVAFVDCTLVRINPSADADAGPSARAHAAPSVPSPRGPRGLGTCLMPVSSVLGSRSWPSRPGSADSAREAFDLHDLRHALAAAGRAAAT